MVSIWELSTVLRNLPQSWECMSLACHRLLGVSSYSIRIHIKVAIIHHFFALTFSYGWKQRTGKLHPVWQMTGWHRSTGCPLANCCYWRRGREQIDSRCSNYRACSSSQRDCSQLHRRRMEKHWLVWGHTMMGVKGKMTYNSNQPSALMCYFTKVGLHQTGEVCS